MTWSGSPSLRSSRPRRPHTWCGERVARMPFMSWSPAKNDVEERCGRMNVLPHEAWHTTLLSGRGAQLAREQTHALDMIRLGEHIDRLDGAERIAALAEDLQVAGEGRRLAGDVDDPVRLRRDQRLQHRRLTADAGRVEQHF